MASPANSIPDSQLGLTADEIRSLRYHQQAALSHGGSSRAASQASSQGRLLLDPTSLAALSSYFDRLMYSIQSRWQSVSSLSFPQLPNGCFAAAIAFDMFLAYSYSPKHQLYQQTQTATQVQYDRAGNAIEMADAEIARFHEILRQIDELQNEFDKVRRIGEIVKGFRQRVEALDRRV